MRTNAEPHETIIHFIQKLNGILNIADVAETYTHIYYCYYCTSSLGHVVAHTDLVCHASLISVAKVRSVIFFSG